MQVNQTLSSGIQVRQDFCTSVRFAMFDTGVDAWRYATHGGTVFVVNFRGRCFGITCRHVFGDFNWRQLVVTEKKFGRQMAALRSLCYSTSPTGAAEGSDILDIAVIGFTADVEASFFADPAYIVDHETIGTSRVGDRLQINGTLKDQSEITDQGITPVFALLEFQDQGSTSADPTLREARAEFSDVAFERLAGLSGAPVFNATTRRLAGVAVRGNLRGNVAIVQYVDIFDVMQLLSAVFEGKPRIDYNKTIARPVVRV